MRFFRRSCFWLVSVLLLFMVFSSTFQIEVSASVLDVVDLTPQQTLALYGNTIPARCFANGTWEDCNFTYFGKSSDMVQGYNTYVTPLFVVVVLPPTTTGARGE